MNAFSDEMWSKSHSICMIQWLAYSCMCVRYVWCMEMYPLLIAYRNIMENFASFAFFLVRDSVEQLWYMVTVILFVSRIYLHCIFSLHSDSLCYWYQTFCEQSVDIRCVIFTYMIHIPRIRIHKFTHALNFSRACLFRICVVCIML